MFSYTSGDSSSRLFYNLVIVMWLWKEVYLLLSSPPSLLELLFILDILKFHNNAPWCWYWSFIPPVYSSGHLVCTFNVEISFIFWGCSCVSSFSLMYLFPLLKVLLVWHWILWIGVLIVLCLVLIFPYSFFILFYIRFS